MGVETSSSGHTFRQQASVECVVLGLRQPHPCESSEELYRPFQGVLAICNGSDPYLKNVIHIEKI